MNDMARQLPEQLEQGTVLDGRYRIDGRLGRGGMGEVYRAHHLKVGRNVAIKVLAADYAGLSDVRKRFEREARLASAAGHPGIVEVFDAGELSDGRPYLVMELLRGHELRDELDRERPPVRRAVRWVRDVAWALHAAHGQGVVHRDLKLENVFLVPPAQRSSDPGDPAALESIKVLDFGIAHSGDPGGARLTTPGLAMGTPQYMAPEQVRAAPPTPATDVYALGVILFELLTGQPPHDAETVHEILEAKLSEEPPLLRTIRPEVPEAVEELVAQCLAIDPEARPSSAAQVAERLQAVLSSPTRSLSVSAVAPAPAPAQARRRWFGTWAAAVAVAGVFGLAVFVASRPDPGGIAVRTGAQSTVLGWAVPPSGKPSWPSRSVLPLHPDTLESDPPNPPNPVVQPTNRPAGGATVSDPPRKKPKPSPSARSDGRQNDVDCSLVRQRAEEKRKYFDWRGVLALSRRRACWDDKSARLRYEVLALKELGRFQECAKRGGRSHDPQVIDDVKLCRARAQKEGR